MIRQTEELMEAMQETANKKRAETVEKDLTDEGKVQMRAVEDACKLLEDAGVAFYLFPYIANDKTNHEKYTGIKGHMWQFNSFKPAGLFSGPGGTFSKEDQNKIYYIWRDLLYVFLSSTINLDICDDLELYSRERADLFKDAFNWVFAQKQKQLEERNEGNS